MSYILDALRRADAERQLGRPPDLHAQPLPAAVLDDRAAPTRRRLAWLAAGLATVAAVLLAAWLAPSWWRAPAPAPSAPPAAPVAVSPAPPPLTTPTTPTTPPVEPARPQPLPATRADDVVSPGAAATAAPAPALSALPPLPPPTPPRTEARVAPPPQVPATPAAAVTTPATASTAPAPSLRERPDLQGQLPPIVFGGSVYSEQASARMVVLNGRVFREGETIMPDLVVDEIRPRGAVLRWREQRFSLP